MKFDSQLVDACRAQFPALRREQNDQSVIYFDGPAGTQVPQCVADAMSHYLLHCNANHGGQFTTSIQSDELLHNCHQAHAEFVGATDGDEVAFGQNMTSLTFSFSRALAKTWSAGDEIIVTALDHDANISPWVLAAKEAGAKVHFVGFDPQDYTLDMDDLANKLNEKTQLVAVGCASNATGGINPVKRVAEMAHQVDAKVYLDAVHYGPHGLIDVADWDCDFLACSDYKFFGPHLGMLWGRRELLEELQPFKVRPSDNRLPTRWMTGTQSHESIAAGMACIDYIAGIGTKAGAAEGVSRRESLKAAFAAIVEYEQTLSQKLIEGLSEIEEIEIYGITDLTRLNDRFPTFSIRHRNIPPAELATQLSQHGIFVWNGNYYALEFSERMGFEPEGMVRIGLVHYNTTDEIDRLISVIKQLSHASATA